jgi:hypothetical protein
MRNLLMTVVLALSAPPSLLAQARLLKDIATGSLLPDPRTLLL